MQATQTKSKTALWIGVVYICSFLCYVPELLKQSGVMIPDAMLYLRYCFVLIPALISIIFLLHQHNLKVFLCCNFKIFSLKEIAICVIIALMGITITYWNSFLEKVDLFGYAYSSILSLVIRCMYLFATALIEEIPWRGFLYNRLVAGRKSIGVAIFVGVIWAIWHIPMWLIRNSLTIAEMILWFIWAVLISVVLGMGYSMFRNILSVSLMHMIFNVCFLAPPKFNNIIISLIMIIGFLNIKTGKIQYDKP